MRFDVCLLATLIVAGRSMEGGEQNLTRESGSDGISRGKQLSLTQGQVLLQNAAVAQKENMEVHTESMTGAPCKIIDVCVVGGGPSGVYAAYKLEERGYKVAVFEDRPMVGGKTEIPANPDGSKNVRTLYAEGAMPTVGEVIDEMGLTGTPLPTRNFFFSTGQIVPSPLPTQETIGALTRYVELTAPGGSIFPYVSSGNYDKVPVELTVPFAQWATVNNLTAVFPVFYNFVTNYGYDFLANVPAIYILSYIPYNAFPLDKWQLMDLQLVVEYIAQRLADVRLNSKITSIQSGPHLSVLQVEGRDSVKCNRTIIAFPQFTDAMAILEGLDTSVFDKVKKVFYYEATVRNAAFVPGIVPDGTSYVQAPSLGVTNHEPNVYARHLENNASLVVFNSGQVKRSKEEVLDIIRSHMKKLWSIDVPLHDIEFWREWSYFPHTSPDDFSMFYEDTAKLQGKNNIYFTGALFKFEVVDKAMQHAKYVVETYFPKKIKTGKGGKGR